MGSYNWPPLPTGGGGGSGTVTSVGLADTSTIPIYTITNSPVTTSGTLDLTLIAQNANLIFAGPTSGSPAQPAFRSLVVADLPSLIPLSLLASQANNTVVGNTSGSSASPIALALGTLTEVTSSVLTLSGWAHATIGSPTIQVNQASASQSGYLSATDWTTFNSKQNAFSTLSVANGGTGNFSLIQYAVLLGAGTFPVNFASPGSSVGFCLTSNGASANPTFQAPNVSVAAGTLAAANGGTGNSTNPLYEILAGDGSASLQSISNGTAGYPMVSNGSGDFPAFEALILNAATTGYVNGLALKGVTEFNTYSALSTDDSIACSGGAFTVSLPSSPAQGKVYKIIKTDASLSNIITVSGTGISRTLNTQNESCTVQYIGMTYVLTEAYVPATSSSYTPSFTAFGTVSTQTFFWKRIGSGILIQGTFAQGTATGSTAAVSLPSGLTASASYSSAANTVVGNYALGTNSGTYFPVLLAQSGTAVNFGAGTASSNGLAATTGSNLGGGINMSLSCFVEIAGWNG
jgi:hypothetical protein